jgi:hypothetical protein
VNDPANRSSSPLESDRAVKVLPAPLAEGLGEGPFVAIVRSRDELFRWLWNPPAGLQWLQVEGLLGDPDVWAKVAQGESGIPLDVHLAEPASEYSDLYRLVEVCAVRDVRVSMPASPGFLKAVRLAAALRLPVRLLPGQPAPEVLAELSAALSFYIRDPMVEAPVEFFHSVLASMFGADPGSLWTILEEDPALFQLQDADGYPKLPRVLEIDSQEVSPATFVEGRFRHLVEENTECATCPWQRICQGYFKWPDPAYSCPGVKELFSAIETAAGEMGRELARLDRAREGGPARVPAKQAAKGK